MEDSRTGDIAPAEPPTEFLCPITLELMEDPVLAADGHTYEREVIVSWLQRSKTSPKTNEAMDSDRVVPNHTLKSLIQDFAARAGLEMPSVQATAAGTNDPKDDSPAVVALANVDLSAAPKSVGAIAAETQDSPVVETLVEAPCKASAGTDAKLTAKHQSSGPVSRPDSPDDSSVITAVVASDSGSLAPRPKKLSRKKTTTRDGNSKDTEVDVDASTAITKELIASVSQSVAPACDSTSAGKNTKLGLDDAHSEDAGVDRRLLADTMLKEAISHLSSDFPCMDRER